MPGLQDFKMVWSHEQLITVDQKCMPIPGVNGLLFHFGRCWRGQESLLVWGSVVVLNNEHPSCWNLCIIFASCRPATYRSMTVVYCNMLVLATHVFQNLLAKRQVDRPDSFNTSHTRTINCTLSHAHMLVKLWVCSICRKCMMLWLKWDATVDVLNFIGI